MTTAKKPIPLSSEAAYEQLKNYPEWSVEKGRLFRNIRFKNFSEAVRFVNRIAEVAEKIGHHPNLYLHEYYFVRVESYTHIINDLSQSDIDMARQIDEILQEFHK